MRWARRARDFSAGLALAAALTGGAYAAGTERTSSRAANVAEVSVATIAKTGNGADRWNALGREIGCNGQVTAVVAAPDGSVYYGGDFTACGGVAASGVARFDPATQAWSALGSGPDQGVQSGPGGKVLALALADNTLYLGGGFTRAGGQTANRVARYSLTTGRWSSLGTGAANGVDNNAFALAVDGNQVYVGGGFTRAGGIPVNRIARFDTSRGTWFPLGSGAADGVVGQVFVLAAANGIVYAGGSFVSAGTVFANHIATYTVASDTWNALGPGPANGIGSGLVSAIEIAGPDVFVGGQFTSAGGSTANNIARYHAPTDAWFSVGSSGNGTSGEVKALTRSGTTLYVGGSFQAAGSIAAAHAARYDTASGIWSALSSSALSVDMPIQALALAGTKLYAAGLFNSAAGLPASRVARYDVVGGAWSPLGSQRNGIGGGGVGRPYRVAVSGDQVIVAGNFNEAGGQPANNIARFDTTTRSWAPLGSGLNGPANALAISDRRVFVGGAFSFAGGIAANNVAEYDLSDGTWRTVGSGAEQGVNGTVNAIAVVGFDVYVAGGFNQAGSTSANYVAQYNLLGGGWSNLGGTNEGVNAAAYALAVSNGIVYVGGDFTRAGGSGLGSIVASRVARFVPGTGWQSFGTGSGNGVNERVATLATIDNHIYVGGNFTQAGGAGANHIARFTPDPETWTVLGEGAANGTNSPVSEIAADGQSVLVSGSFNTANGVPANNVARYDATTSAWTSLGTGTANGVNASAYGVTASQSQVYVVGDFSQAGGSDALRIAAYDARAAVTTTLQTTSASFPVGTSATLNATVALAAFPVNASSVDFLDGADPIDGCTAVPLFGSGTTRTATCTTSTLGAGVRNLYAVYSGESRNARDTSLALVVDVTPPLITLSPATLTEALLNSPYSQTLAASGTSGAQPPFAFSVTAGALPPGLGLDPGTGVVSGTPTATGTFNFTVGASDTSPRDLSGPFLGSRSYALFVRGLATTTTLASNGSPSLVNANVMLTASVAGQSPAGTVDFRNGGSSIANCAAVALAGTGNQRTAACTTDTLAVGDRTLDAIYSGDPTNDTSTSATLTQTVMPPVITLAPTTLPNGQTGVPYSQPVTASGAGARLPFTFDPGGTNLPAGLQVFGEGVVSGTPSTIGTTTFTIRAVDKSSPSVGGTFVGQRSYTVEITLQTTTTTIGTISPSPATQGASYNVPVSVTGVIGTPPGAVTIDDGAGGSCTAILSGGSGSCGMVSSVVGTRTLTANYLGAGGVYGPSTDTETVVVGPSGGGSNSRISVGARTGVRGQSIAVPVSFRGDGQTVQFTAQITFDKDRLAFVSAQAIGGALCNRLVAPNDDRIGVQAPGTPTGQPLSPNLDTRYCELTFDIASTAPGGSYVLGVVTSQCQDGGGVNRTCLVTNGAINVSAVELSVPNLSLLAISGYESTVSASRSVRVTNRGDTALAVNCQVNGPAEFSLDAGAALNLPAQQGGTIAVGCALPPLGTTLTGQLVCTTSDPARPTLQYGLTCNRVANGTPLPEDQIFDDGLKQGDQLGTSTAVSTRNTDRDVMVVGAPFAGADTNGRVLIMERVGAGELAPASFAGGKRMIAAPGLRTIAMLAPPAVSSAKGAGAQIGDKFGQAVAVAPDGNRIAVGAPLAGSQSTGQVLIYQRPASGWQDVNLAQPAGVVGAPLLPGSSVSEFGAALAFLPDGDLVVGAPGTASGVSGVGAAFVFDAGSGATYTQREVLQSTVPQSQGRFGAAVGAGVDADGNGQLVVGAPQEGALSPIDQRPGGAYVFPIAGGAVGIPQRVLPTGSSLGDKFGSAVAVGSGVIAIGAEGDDTTAGNDSGSATLFRPRPDNSAVDPVTTLIPGPGATQGAGAAIATNGDIVLLGAPLATVGGRTGSGRVYVYDVEEAYATTESPLQTIENSGGQNDDRFGRALAINRRSALAGVPLDDREIDANTSLLDVGRADPFALDRILRAGFE